MKLIIVLLAGLLLVTAIACRDSEPSDLGDPYTAPQLIQARNENASRFDLEWKDNRINIAGVVERVDGGRIYLRSDNPPENVALTDLSQEEQAKWNPGDEVEYACVVGDYIVLTIFMDDCGPAEHGEPIEGASMGDSLREGLANIDDILRYWSIPALVIASILTFTAIARSTWRGWQPAMFALMFLGVLAILNHVAAVVLGYTTVSLNLLTPLAAISFVGICVLGWIALNPERFPGINGVTLTPPAPIVQPPPADAPDTTVASDSQETAVGAPGSPVAAAVTEPSQTIAMQPTAARSMAWLVVTKGPAQGKSIQLKEGPNTIGRSLENDLQIDDASVSRAHAMLIVDGNGFTLVDLGSTGGTRIGDHRISGKLVAAGSSVIVGQTRLSLVSVDAFQGGAASGATMIGSPTGSSLSLIAQSGPDAGKSFLLSDARNVIGRDPSAQVVLSDPTVSRQHALIRVDPDRATIADLGSRSGTQADGERITGVQVAVGDHIVIGQSEFTLMRPG